MLNHPVPFLLLGEDMEGGYPSWGGWDPSSEARQVPTLCAQKAVLADIYWLLLHLVVILVLLSVCPPRAGILRV